MAEAADGASAEIAGHLIDRFRTQGFVRVDGLLSDAELERYGRAVDEAVAARMGFDPRPIESKSRYEQSFQQCLNLWEDRPDVRPLTFHPRIARTAARLLGAEAVRVWHDQALYKEPAGRVTDPHQDQPYWTIAEPDTVTAWIPFQDVSDANGRMGFLPGSHRAGHAEFADIFTSTGLDLANHPVWRDRPIEWMDVPRGAVSFHHGLTVHCARPNRSSAPRRVHTVIFFRDGCTRTRRGRHPSTDREGLAPGARIDSAVTPIAWPREGGLPEPPAPPEPRIRGWPGWSDDANRLAAGPRAADGREI